MRIHTSITLDRVIAAVERGHSSLDSPGFCIFCGADAESVEPDARRYQCEADSAPLEYTIASIRPKAAEQPSGSLYEGYRLQTLAIAGAAPHPTRLVESVAMAAVAPPSPAYRPHVRPRMVTNGLLSDAQLESVVYAGNAHGAFLAGAYTPFQTCGPST